MAFSMPMLSDTPILAGLAAAMLLAAFLLLRRKLSWASSIRRKPLLTPNEIEFFQRLQRALPTHEIFPQVSLAALLTDSGSLSAKARWRVRARFDRKIVDFVVCDRRTLDVVALVELDDRLHVASADRKRDALTRAGGYHTLRFQSKQKPSIAEIAALFEHAAGWVTGRHFD